MLARIKRRKGLSTTTRLIAALSASIVFAYFAGEYLLAAH